jgi:hypothetical protein
MALPIFGKFFKDVFADPTLNYTEDFVFEAPEGFDIDLNCGESRTEIDRSKSDYDEYF